MFNLGCVTGPISCLMGRYFYLSRALRLFWDPERHQCEKGEYRVSFYRACLNSSCEDSKNAGRPLDLGVPKNLSPGVMAPEDTKEGLVLPWEKVHGF